MAGIVRDDTVIVLPTMPGAAPPLHVERGDLRGVPRPGAADALRGGACGAAADLPAADHRQQPAGRPFADRAAAPRPGADRTGGPGSDAVTLGRGASRGRAAIWPHSGILSRVEGYLVRLASILAAGVALFGAAPAFAHPARLCRCARRDRFRRRPARSTAIRHIWQFDPDFSQMATLEPRRQRRRQADAGRARPARQDQHGFAEGVRLLHLPAGERAQDQVHTSRRNTFSPSTISG